VKSIKRFKKHLDSLISAINNAVTPGGPGITAVYVKTIATDLISLVVLELPTEIVYGQMDGSEIFYGFAFDLETLHDCLDIDTVNFVVDENGSTLEVKALTDTEPLRCVHIQVVGDTPNGAAVGQKYDDRTGKYTVQPLPDTVIAIITGKPE